MDWVFDHLRLIIFAAGAIAWWLKQRKDGQSGDKVKPHKEVTFDDPELAERTRRIREEIQRKIEQRARAYTQPPPKVSRPAPAPAAPPPVVREVVRRQPEPPPLSKAAVAHLDAARTAEILEQQAAMAEKLRQAAEMKAAALRRIQYENQVSSGDQAAVVARGALGDDLRNPDSLRRAFILREIIGPPVSLRG